jgi:hypothetical protein
MLQRAGVAMDSVSDDSESSGDEAASAKSDAGSDSLNFREWAEVAAEAAEEEDIAPPTEAELREGFAALDADGSGTVSLAELGAAAGGAGGAGAGRCGTRARARALSCGSEARGWRGRRGMLGRRR